MKYYNIYIYIYIYIIYPDICGNHSHVVTFCHIFLGEIHRKCADSDGFPVFWDPSPGVPVAGSGHDRPGAKFFGGTLWVGISW